MTQEMTCGTDLATLSIGPISRTTLALFAGASGDHNPIHIDSDFAKLAGMPDVFVHGMLSMAYLGRLLTRWVPQRQIRSFRVRFAAITPLLAKPICTGTVVSVDDIDGETRITVNLTVALEDGTITLSGDAVVAVL
jgi:acyl dehydratase